MDLAAQAGIYLHVPFCRRKCPYCSFFSIVPQAGDIRRYVETVRLQMRQLAAVPEIQALRFATVFFGGGTPSLLPPEALATLLADCRAVFPFATEQPEITIEVNPGTIDPTGLRQLNRAGCNRLSIGIQSLDDRELHQLGRIHTADEALAILAAAREAGFENCSADLMYGLPGQTVNSWQRGLERILAAGIDHCSLYELTVEEHTPFARQLAQRQWTLPPEDEVLAMMTAIDRTVGRHGLHRYEISNYALPGLECAHNRNYWQNGWYLGLGPGAVAAFGGQRRTAVADLAAYCHRIATGQTVWQTTERLDAEAAFRETVIMGLRLLAGVSISALAQRFAIHLPTYYGPTLSRLLDQGLVILEHDRLRLSPTGLPLANRVMAELV